MKIIKLLTHAAFVVGLTLHASAQTGVIDVQFGNLYNNDNPTTFVSGTGVLGGALTGSEFYWVCLDSTQTAPANTLVSYDVSTDPSVMQAGNFGSGGYDADARGAIVQATTNMFYAFQNELLTTSGSEYGSAFQRAVWGVTYGYLVWGQSGPLTSDVINNVISNYGPYIDDEPLIGDFLLAALTAPTGDSTVYFGSPTNDSSLQPVMFFPAASVPEPSTLTLTGMLGLFFISRRKRN